MDLSRRGRPVVAAELAPAAGLCDEDRLDTPPAASHGVGLAPPAAMTPIGPAHECRLAVDRAEKKPVAAHLAGRSSSSAASGFEPVPPQPMPNSPSADGKPLGDLPDRQPLRDQQLELLASQPAASRVLRAVGCLEVVLLHPVPDSRRMHVEPPPDLLEREPLSDKRLQLRAIHDDYSAGGLGRKKRTCVRTPARRVRPASRLVLARKGFLEGGLPRSRRPQDVYSSRSRSRCASREFFSFMSVRDSI